MAARKIMGVNSRHTAKPLLSELGWINLRDKRSLHKCVLFKKMLDGKGPIALLEELDSYRRETVPVTATRSNSENMVLKHSNTEYGRRTFFNGAIRAWGTLPPEIKGIKNIKSFKERLHQHLLTRCRHET